MEPGNACFFFPYVPSGGGGGLESQVRRPVGQRMWFRGETLLSLFGGVAGVLWDVMGPLLAVWPGPEFSLEGAVHWPGLRVWSRHHRCSESPYCSLCCSVLRKGLGGLLQSFPQ